MNLSYADDNGDLQSIQIEGEAIYRCVPILPYECSSYEEQIDAYRQRSGRSSVDKQILFTTDPISDQDCDMIIDMLCSSHVILRDWQGYDRDIIVTSDELEMHIADVRPHSINLLFRFADSDPSKDTFIVGQTTNRIFTSQFSHQFA